MGGASSVAGVGVTGSVLPCHVTVEGLTFFAWLAYTFQVPWGEVFFCPSPSGCEVEADRTHIKREANTTGRLFPLPRQIGVLF